MVGFIQERLITTYPKQEGPASPLLDRCLRHGVAGEALSRKSTIGVDAHFLFGVKTLIQSEGTSFSYSTNEISHQFAKQLSAQVESNLLWFQTTLQ